MNTIFSESAWREYTVWQTEDKKIIKKINELIQSIKRDGYAKGLGQPEPLKHDLSGCWSRRIDGEHRLVYTIDSNKNLVILKCKDHY